MPKELSELTNDEAVALLTAAFDGSGVTFKDKAGALASFKKSHHLIVTDDGIETVYNGHRQPLHLAWSQWGRTGEGEQFTDRRSLPKDEQNPGGIRSKADLPDNKSRVDYINRFGGLAYEKLAINHQPIEETKYRDEYYKLSRSQKVELLKKGVDASSFPPRPDPDQIAGGKINRTALERDMATRPNQK
jgi:hypothetical protein